MGSFSTFYPLFLCHVFYATGHGHSALFMYVTLKLLRGFLQKDVIMTLQVRK